MTSLLIMLWNDILKQFEVNLLAPNVDLSWHEYVSNLEQLCLPLHVTQLNFISHRLLGNVKATFCVRFLHLRVIRGSNCMHFFCLVCSKCMSASTVLILEHSSLLYLCVAECRSVYSTVKYEWPSESFSVAYTQKLEISTKIDVYSYRRA